MWDAYECTGSWMPFGWLWFAIFWIGIIVIGLWVIRKLTGRPGSGNIQYALDIAKQRYAGGEISREEFEQIKRDLK